MGAWTAVLKRNLSPYVRPGARRALMCEEYGACLKGGNTSDVLPISEVPRWVPGAKT